MKHNPCSNPTMEAILTSTGVGCKDSTFIPSFAPLYFCVSSLVSRAYLDARAFLAAATQSRPNTSNASSLDPAPSFCYSRARNSILQSYLTPFTLVTFRPPLENLLERHLRQPPSIGTGFLQSNLVVLNSSATRPPTGYLIWTQERATLRRLLD
jgi:hypothetical protein